MKKTTFILMIGAICLLCASCKIDDTTTDPRDAIVGTYTFTQTGSYSLLSITESVDTEGSFDIDKNTSTTTGLVFHGNDFLIKEGWVAGKNTMQIAQIKASEPISGYTANYTVTFSPCEVFNKNFTAIGTINGSVYVSGTYYPITGTVSITAKGR